MNKGLSFEKAIDIVFQIYVISILTLSFFEGLNLVANAIAGLLFFMCFFRRARLSNTPPVWFYFGFVLVLFLTLGVSVNLSYSLDRARTTFLLLTVNLYVYNYYYHSRYDLEKLVNLFSRAFIVAGLVLGLIIVGMIGPSDFLRAILSGRRLGLGETQINTCGIISALTCIMIYYHAIYNRKWQLLIVSALPFLVALLSVSKKVVVMLIIGIVMLSWMRYGYRRVFKTLGIMIVVCVGIYLALQFEIFAPVRHRFEMMWRTAVVGDANNFSTIQRQEMVELGWRWFRERPLLGHGADGFRAMYDQEKYAHNNYIELLVDFGIVGFIAYYWFWVWSLRVLWRSKMDCVKLVLTLSTISVITDFMRVSYYSKNNYYIVLMAMIVATRLANNPYGDPVEGRPNGRLANPARAFGATTNGWGAR